MLRKFANQCNFIKIGQKKEAKTSLKPVKTGDFGSETEFAEA